MPETTLCIYLIKHTKPTSFYSVRHEKRGIPAELLHVVDKCLEIPQLGVVRSLNVHVTGAIAIWQYASQHLIP